ncbi:MAG: TlpA disulfide reductase family protein [Elusimicrobiales bacterium]|nr:TlpA disulfide reductase family protein [Elusimicrobiales bacterium]
MKRIIAGLALALLTAPAMAASTDTAKDFSLKGLDGKEFRLSESTGKGYIVINFWAAWCSTCKEEIPELEELMKQPGADKAVFLGINVGDKDSKAAKFVKKYGYPYRPLMDSKKAVSKDYGILGIPVTIIINNSGKIVFRGSRPPEKFDFTESSPSKTQSPKR